MTDSDLFDAAGAPEPAGFRPGPAFTATYSGECSFGDDIEPGDSIRADGEGGWAHADCLED